MTEIADPVVAGSVKAACEAAKADGCKVCVDYDDVCRVGRSNSPEQTEEATRVGDPIDDPCAQRRVEQRTPDAQRRRPRTSKRMEMRWTMWSEVTDE